MRPGELPHGLYAPRATKLRAAQVAEFVTWAGTHGWTREDIGGGEGHVFLRKGETTYSYQVMAEGEVEVCRGTSFSAAPFAQRYCAEVTK